MSDTGGWENVALMRINVDRGCVIYNDILQQVER